MVEMGTMSPEIDNQDKVPTKGALPDWATKAAMETIVDNPDILPRLDDLVQRATNRYKSQIGDISDTAVGMAQDALFRSFARELFNRPGTTVSDILAERLKPVEVDGVPVLDKSGKQVIPLKRDLANIARSAARSAATYALRSKGVFHDKPSDEDIADEVAGNGWNVDTVLKRAEVYSSGAYVPLLVEPDNWHAPLVLVPDLDNWGERYDRAACARAVLSARMPRYGYASPKRTIGVAQGETPLISSIDTQLLNRDTADRWRTERERDILRNVFEVVDSDDWAPSRQTERNVWNGLKSVARRMADATGQRWTVTDILLMSDSSVLSEMGVLDDEHLSPPYAPNVTYGTFKAKRAEKASYTRSLNSSTLAHLAGVGGDSGASAVRRLLRGQSGRPDFAENGQAVHLAAYVRDVQATLREWDKKAYLAQNVRNHVEAVQSGLPVTYRTMRTNSGERYEVPITAGSGGFGQFGQLSVLSDVRRLPGSIQMPVLPEVFCAVHNVVNARVCPVCVEMARIATDERFAAFESWCALRPEIRDETDMPVISPKAPKPVNRADMVQLPLSHVIRYKTGEVRVIV